MTSYDAYIRFYRGNNDDLGDSMKWSPRTLAVLLLISAVAVQAQPTNGTPAWAFPIAAPAPPAPADSVALLHVPGSTRAFTEARSRDRYNVIDWYPRAHPRMPASVEHGQKPRVFACAFCHLPDGMGRPENAMIAGLSTDYILQQLTEFKTRARHAAWPVTFPPDSAMRMVADSATDDEARAAAQYFSHLPRRRRSQVVEATVIPRVRPGTGLYFKSKDGGTEPLERRLIEVATDAERHELHDARAGYVAYVPPGSIAAGRKLATLGRTDGPKACITCHGPQLRGAGPVPSLAGSAPSYILRQLLAFKQGTRSSALSAPMRDVAAKLSVDDMIALAAYAGSRTP